MAVAPPRIVNTAEAVAEEGRAAASAATHKLAPARSALQTNSARALRPRRNHIARLDVAGHAGPRRTLPYPISPRLE